MPKHLTTATAVMLLALTACSNSGDTSDKTPAESRHTTTVAPDTANLEQAVRDYTAAYFKPDPATGYAMLSKRCKAEISQAMFAAQLEQASKDYGPQTVKTITVDQVSGDLARVTYGVGLPVLDQNGQPWAREDGEWRFDAC